MSRKDLSIDEIRKRNQAAAAYGETPASPKPEGASISLSREVVEALSMKKQFPEGIEFEPDTNVGMSSEDLGRSFKALFTPAPPEAKVEPEGATLGTCDASIDGKVKFRPHIEMSGCVNWKPIAPEAAGGDKNEIYSDRISDNDADSDGGLARRVDGEKETNGSDVVSRMGDPERNLTIDSTKVAAPSPVVQPTREQIADQIRSSLNREIEELKSELSTIRRELALSDAAHIDACNQLCTAEAQLRELTAEKEADNRDWKQIAVSFGSKSETREDIVKAGRELRSTIERLEGELKKASEDRQPNS